MLHTLELVQGQSDQYCPEYDSSLKHGHNLNTGFFEYFLFIAEVKETHAVCKAVNVQQINVHNMLDYLGSTI